MGTNFSFAVLLSSSTMSSIFYARLFSLCMLVCTQIFFFSTFYFFSQVRTRLIVISVVSTCDKRPTWKVLTENVHRIVSDKLTCQHRYENETVLFVTKMHLWTSPRKWTWQLRQENEPDNFVTKMNLITSSRKCTSQFRQENECVCIITKLHMLFTFWKSYLGRTSRTEG